MTLKLHFVKPTPLPELSVENVQILGNEQTLPVTIKRVTGGDGDGTFTIELNATGDTSTYTLRLIDSATEGGKSLLDPRLTEVRFTFSGKLPDVALVPPLPPVADPDVNYLAKDYVSFRQMMLDRLALLVPGGIKDQPADLNVALVELLAFTADRLSYYQDAVATEAYLGTARSRISLRRHARLLGYKVHEGCNARAFVFCSAGAGTSADCKVVDTWRFSTTPDLTTGEQRIVFQPCHSVQLLPSHNRIEIHNWSEDDFSLTSGATSATLRVGPGVNLQAGDFLLLESTNEPNDDTGLLCQVVRLTSVVPGTDQVENQAIVEVAWGSADALTFELPVQSSASDGQLAVARGNVVLADQGEALLNPDTVDLTSGPRLSQAPLTFAETLPPDLSNPSITWTPAATLMQRDARAAKPAITLEQNQTVWRPQDDLLACNSGDTCFVVETEYNGTARLRFGDNVYGRQPDSNAQLSARYRVGNGVAGNVGAEMINTVQIRTANGDLQSCPGVDGVRNPLPAQGGQDPELAEQVRLFAPQAFRVQERAINASDYAARAQCCAGVQRAAADFQWTGSWYTVYLYIERQEGREIDDGFKAELLVYMDRYRLAGYDLEILGPSYVELDISLRFDVKPGFTPNTVRSALVDALSNRTLPGGKRGYFHPDNWGFEQPVYLSQFCSVALAVPGVQSIDVMTFCRKGAKDDQSLKQGEITMGPHEIVNWSGPDTNAVLPPANLSLTSQYVARGVA